MSTIGDRAFPVPAARVWNSLPQQCTSRRHHHSEYWLLTVLAWILFYRTLLCSSQLVPANTYRPIRCDSDSRFCCTYILGYTLLILWGWRRLLPYGCTWQRHCNQCTAFLIKKIIIRVQLESIPCEIGSSSSDVVLETITLPRGLADRSSCFTASASLRPRRLLLVARICLEIKTLTLTISLV